MNRNQMRTILVVMCAGVMLHGCGGSGGSGDPDRSRSDANDGGTGSNNTPPANSRPFAISDTASVAEDDSVLVGVLDNDSDVDGNLAEDSIVVTVQPQNGVATVEADGRILYRPDPDFNGEDTFQYTVADTGALTSQPATVTIEILPVNDVPVAANDEVVINQYQSVRIDPTANDTFADGKAPCSLVEDELGTPQTGLARIIGGCLIEYFPEWGAPGDDSFTYRVVDVDGDSTEGRIDVSITDDGKVFKVHSTDNVASLAQTETTFMPGGTDSRRRAQRWTNTVMSFVADDFDFIIFVQNCPNCVGPSGLFWDVRNDIEGIGKPIFDDGDQWGSAARLTGVAYLKDRRGVKFGPSLHELLHNWAVFFRPPNGDDIPASHWGVVGTPGQLGGFDPATLTDLGGGQYQASNGRPGSNSFGVNANGGNSLPYSAHELYLMGLLAPSSVSPLVIPVNPAPVDFANGIFSADSLAEQTVDDIVSDVGPRLPAAGDAQTAFKALIVLVWGAHPYDEDLDEVAEHSEWLSFPGFDSEPDIYNFHEATLGVGSLETGNLGQSLIN